MGCLGECLAFFSSSGSARDAPLQKSLALPEAEAAPAPAARPAWSERERADYGKLYAEHVFSASDLFQRSGLPRKALKAIWQAANPELHQALSEEQFFLCCRLIANCQAKGEELRVLEEGGPELEGLLERLAHRVPEVAPSFELPAAAWGDMELAAYDCLFACTRSGDPTLVPELFQRTALPRHTLKAVWQVANPDGQAKLTLEKFRCCCRLLAHCQKLARDPQHEGLLEAGGPPLEQLLGHLAAQAPESTPSFIVAGWSDPEQATYRKLYGESKSGDTEATRLLFEQLGLPPDTLKAIWSVGNPESRAPMDEGSFWKSCRLLFHAVVLKAQERNVPLLHGGGEPLEQLFRGCLAAVSPAELPASAVSNWTGGEKAAYQRWFEQTQLGDMTLTTQLFERSGLARHTLKAIWEAANPEMKARLGEEEFWLSCRLLGHCQALQKDPAIVRLLEDGGPALVSHLRTKSMLAPPPQLPRLSGVGMTPVPSTSSAVPSPMISAAMAGAYREVGGAAPYVPRAMRREESGASSGGGSPSSMGGALSAADWSKGERVAYDRLFGEFQSLSPGSSGRFFDRTGLPQLALAKILELTMPDRGPQDFWMCCRLIGHCQALHSKERNRALLETGVGEVAGEEKTLEAHLRERCMHRLPPQLPNFRRKPPGATFSA